MRRIRKVLFWAHLVAGVGAGLVILVMSVSGVLLAFEETITVRADGHRSNERAGHVSRAAIDKILANAANAVPATPPTSIVIRSDATLPIAVTFGREKTLLFDAVSGENLGEGARTVRAAFRSINEWHRWLGRPESSRTAGRAVTGACNLAFLFLVFSGIVLWFPRKWSWGSLRSISLFSVTSRGRARDWNWHNVTGLWCAAPLMVIVISGVIMSYPWANALLFRLAGNEAPPARRPETATKEKPASSPWQIEGFDRALQRVEREFPERKAIRARFTQKGAPVSFSIDPVNGRPQQRSQMTVKLESGEVVRIEPSSGFDRGRRWRLLARFLHTGEALGSVGQLIAALASGGGALLVWTGLSLAIRRFSGRRQRDEAPLPVEQAVA